MLKRQDFPKLKLQFLFHSKLPLCLYPQLRPALTVQWRKRMWSAFPSFPPVLPLPSHLTAFLYLQCQGREKPQKKCYCYSCYLAVGLLSGRCINVSFALEHLFVGYWRPLPTPADIFDTLAPDALTSTSFSWLLFNSCHNAICHAASFCFVLISTADCYPGRGPLRTEQVWLTSGVSVLAYGTSACPCSSTKL